VRARNIYGFGPYSDTVTFIADGAPAMMNEVTTTLSYPWVTISFAEPFNNGHSITAYMIQIYSAAQTSFITDALVCDGSQQSATTFEQLSCSVPMSVLLE